MNVSPRCRWIVSLVVGAGMAVQASSLQAQETLREFTAGESPDHPMRDCNTTPNRSGVPAAGWNFVWENDTAVSDAPTDEEYTQGLQFGYRFRPDQQPRWLGRPMGWICRGISAASNEDHRDLYGAGSVFIGQHLFTPGDGDARGLIPDDRPYAAWLYLGTRLEVAQPFEGKFARSGLFHSFELQVGTLGPRAKGEWVQNEFHSLIGSDPLLGWNNQLSDEWGVQAFYKVRALAGKWSGSRIEADVTVTSEVGLGTVQILAGTGGVFRVGRNLGDPVADTLGPRVLESTRDVEGARAAPAQRECLGGRGIFAIKECYAYVGVNGRATAFNAFLDGGMFEGGHRVDREPFTYDLLWGARLRWSRFQLDYTAVTSSREFSPVPAQTQSRDGKHRFGAVNVRCFAPVDENMRRWDLVCPGFFTVLLGLVAAQ
jgi:lipid A 3-O-deacylase